MYTDSHRFSDENTHTYTTVTAPHHTCLLYSIMEAHTACMHAYLHDVSYIIYKRILTDIIRTFQKKD